MKNVLKRECYFWSVSSSTSHSREQVWKDFDGDEYDVSIEPVKDVDRYGGYSSLDLEYHIFDIPVNSNSPWHSQDHDKTRLADLNAVAEAVECEIEVPKIAIVHGEFVANENAVKRFIGRYMQEGYEGVIIRNFKGVYEFGQRSSDLQKWKLFQDGEAKVLDSVEDKNGEGVLLCEEKDGTRFNCKMKGTREERSQARMLLLVGKFINFTFQRYDHHQPTILISTRVCHKSSWRGRCGGDAVEDRFS
ncbi:DNA ligase [Salmonella phage NINP13076]|nr:DNA ligase [Salmonella phage NINP13076]